MDNLTDLTRRVARIEAALAQPILPAIVPPDPPQPPDPPEPTGWRALDHLWSSVDENKRARIPQLRNSRKWRDECGTLGDIRGGDWQYGDEMVWEDKESVVPLGYSQWSSNMHKGNLVRRGGSYTWHNIGVSPAMDAKQLKWGTREYNAPDRVFLNCDFTEIPQEHGLYVSNSGNTTLDGCTFLRVGSQGAQWAYRPLPYQQYGADNMPYEESPYHRVHDSHFVDCALGGTRPSYNLTYFSPGTSEYPGSLEITDSSFVCHWPQARYDGKRSTGALVVTPSQGNLPLSGQNMMREVVVRNCLFDFTAGDRPLISLRSIDSISFVDCAFIARNHTQPWIQIDKDSGGDLGGTKTKTIRFKNCRSDGVQLRVLLAPDSAGKQVPVTHEIDCPGSQLAVSGLTGLPL